MMTFLRGKLLDEKLHPHDPLDMCSEDRFRIGLAARLADGHCIRLDVNMVEVAERSPKTGSRFHTLASWTSERIFLI